MQSYVSIPLLRMCTYGLVAFSGTMVLVEIIYERAGNLVCSRTCARSSFTLTEEISNF